MSQFSIADLEKLIDLRSQASSEKSYTRSLLEQGPERIAKKFGEEAIETVIAVLGPDRRSVICEAADVIYHLLVLLKSKGLTLADVEAELERRTKQSGLDEKANRSN